MSASLLALLLSLVMAGCASLPSQVQRPVSAALADTADTPLARIAAAAAPDDERQLSGFRPLMDGDHALNARIALIRRAQKSLDLQYYLIASDEVGLLLLRELRDAAARGVRVRLLVDDLYAAGQDELFAGLAAHANVELRLFNPLPARSGTFGARIVLSLHEFTRINRRMHNKLFIADNAFAIVGGRNLANEYFMRSESANFIDADVLATGPVVRELSTVFDAYWNSEQAWPVHSLAAGKPADARANFDAMVRDAAAEPTVTPRDRFGRSSVQAQLDSGRLEQRFATAEVFADTPAKAAGSGNAEATPMAAAMGAMRAARSDVLIVSPYFVPGESGMAVAGRHRRAAGALGLCTLSPGDAEDGRGAARTRRTPERAHQRLRRLPFIAGAAACEAGGGRPAAPLHRLDEHGRALGAPEHRAAAGHRQPRTLRRSRLAAHRRAGLAHLSAAPGGRGRSHRVGLDRRSA
ncbi:MAG: phospholipase D family protein [Betaproteobacteria bacterium]|nr:MAG: phospholipase D family protein [Betaproteobacteria bacterium]